VKIRKERYRASLEECIMGMGKYGLMGTLLVETVV
jgi:hypothetical protein